jgi:hypothetical protein
MSALIISGTSLGYREESKMADTCLPLSKCLLHVQGLDARYREGFDGIIGRRLR